ncbi:MAG: PmoA family protein [Planctomycetaceae bacterium]|jgi:hypothetical protein|nr:PmoA family protein [Planctomycetaceae bacterium]
MKHSILTLILTVICVPLTAASENSDHTMASGSFGTAWRNNDGIVQVFDGESVVTPVPSIKTYALAAADVLEEGSDQLIFIDDARKGLNIYSFKTRKLLGPFGSNIKTLSTGRCSAKETYPSVLVCTFRGDSFRWTKEIMDKGWMALPGMFSQVSAGNLDRKNDLDEFAVVDNGGVYIYSTQWNAYTKAVEGKEMTAVLVGNVTDSPGDEMVMFDKSGNTFLYQDRTAEELHQKVKALAFGKNAGQTDTLYALDLSGKPVVYDRKTKSWKDLFTNNAFSCSSLIARTHPGGDGHTLYVVRADGNLYRIEKGVTKQLSEQLASKILLQSGDTSLAEYRFAGVPFKPYLDKLLTPSGRNILRDAPHDHLHHHGLMFALAVDGCNFWEESRSDHGREITVSVQPDPGTETSSLVSELDWKNSHSQTLLKETRKIAVSQGGNVTLLDWESALRPASGEKGAYLDKISHYYYGLGTRFDQTMDRNGRFFSDSGTNKAEVVRNDERLTSCRWMAYTAKLNGEPVTVAVFGHPSNPIPTLAFTMGDTGKSFAYLGITLNLHREPVTIEPGTSLVFRYRVAVWDGEVSPETVEKTFTDYAQ